MLVVVKGSGYCVHVVGENKKMNVGIVVLYNIHILKQVSHVNYTNKINMEIS